MLNIDKLRYNWEKPFLDLMEGMERKVHPNDPHRTLWYKNNEWYFEENNEEGIFWCQTTRTWENFEINYSLNYTNIQFIIKNLIHKYYNLKSLIPGNMEWNIPNHIESKYKINANK